MILLLVVALLGCGGGDVVGGGCGGRVRVCVRGGGWERSAYSNESRGSGARMCAHALVLLERMHTLTCRYCGTNFLQQITTKYIACCDPAHTNAAVC